MRKGLSGLVAAVVGVGMVASGCAGDASSGGSDDKFRVMITAGLSAQGVLAANSRTSVNSAKASAAALNREGGIDGRQIEVIVSDDGGKPTTAVTNLREQVAKQKPDLYLNSGPSTIASATLPILQQNKIVSFNIGPTADSSDPSKFPLNFDLSPSPSDYAKGFVEHAKEKGYRTVAMIHGSSTYSIAFGEQVEKAFTEAGIRVATNQQFEQDSLDMTPQLQAAQATKADVLVMDAYGAAVGYLLKSLEKLGWDVPVLADNSVSATGLMSTPPPDGALGTSQVKNVLMQVFHSTVADPSDKRVNDAVAAMKKFGEIPSTLINAYNYDALPLIAAAVESAGGTDDPAEVAKALEDPEVQQKAETVILREYHFTAEAHSPNSTADAFVFIKPSVLKDGQFQG